MTVIATSPQGTAEEEVQLLVLASQPSTKPNQVNQLDLQVVGGGGVSVTSSTEAPSAGHAGGSLTVITILLVVGVVLVVGGILWCWNRHRRLVAARSKVRCWLSVDKQSKSFTEYTE